MDLDIRGYLLKIQKSFQDEVAFIQEQSQKLKGKSDFKKAVEERVAYFPIQFYKTAFNALGQKVYTFHKHQHFTNFNDGTPVFLHHDKWDQPVPCIIHQQTEHEIEITLHDFFDHLPKGSFCLSLRTDEDQIKIMQQYLGEALDDNHPLHQQLYQFSPINDDTCSFDTLNTSQSKACQDAIRSEGNLIIHGPPGTGKSVTLTAIVRELVKKDLKILVATPSNAACDHLAGKIMKNGIDLVRIGHAAKVNARLHERTPIALFQNSEAAGRIENYNKQIQQLEKSVQKFHRNFSKEEREQRQHNRKEIKQLKKEIKSEKDHFYDQLIEQHQVVCGTLIGIEKEMVNATDFDVCIIDEAGQATTPALLVPVAKAQRFILAGDPLQLPPTVLHSEKAALKETLLSFYMTNDVPSHFLDTQYRMQQPIMDLINLLFYDGRLHMGIEAQQRECITFIDTAGTGFEEAKSDNDSTYNEGEIKVIEQFITQEDLQNGVIITPYSAQIEKIKATIKDLPVASVDAFQGSEAETVIFSCVRSNEDGQIGFLKDYRRLNVALSRAQKQLIIIGDSVTLSQDPVFDKMLTFIQEQQVYRSAYEFEVF